jgi:hypothetical protein
MEGARQHAADLVIGRRRQGPELDRPFLTLEEDAVEEQRVEMDVEIQSAPEARDDRHRARSPVADAIAAGAVPLEAQQHAHGYGEHRPRQPVIPREQVPKPVRQLSTHWRTGTRGSTPSTSRAALSVMRRPPQLGQKPRPLHENGTSRSSVHSVHRRRAKPCARIPQVRKS